MVLKSNETIDKNLSELVFTIDRAKFDEAVTDAYRKNVKRMNIPGFRKGKAPKAIVEKMYGKGVFYEDALNAILPDEYETALKESGLDVVSRPEFDVDDIGDEGVTVKAKVYTRPEAEIGDYDGIEEERELTPVTDEDVQKELERVQQRNSRTVEVTDRAAAIDDTANIDYTGYIGDKKFDGGEGKAYDLKLGSNSFIPGFEDQIVGHVAGDEFDVNVTFPENYHAEELKGKPAVFKTKLNAIKVTELPELDDEFAKDVSEFDTLDELKADIKKQIEADRQKAVDVAFENALIEKVADTIECEIPEVLIEQQCRRFLEEFKSRIMAQGIPYDQYVKMTGMDEKKFLEEGREPALKQVKMDLAIAQIIEEEKLEATPEEIEEEYKKLSGYYGMDVEMVKKYLGENEVRTQVLNTKAVAVVVDNAKATKPAAKKAAKKADDAEAGKEEKKPAKKTAKKAEDGEEKPAKKPAAKKTAKKAE